MMRVLPCLLLCLWACQPEVAPPYTPGGGTGQNALGQLCTMAGGCPANHQCVFTASGNPTQGYCSPLCTESGNECRDGYTGPQTGTLNCFVPNTPQACSIQCQADTDCPVTMACKIPSNPNQPFRFCSTR
jgi:hypothetical protein